MNVAKRLLTDAHSCLNCTRLDGDRCRLKKRLPKSMICKQWSNGLIVEWSRQSEALLRSYSSYDVEDALSEIIQKELRDVVDKIAEERLKGESDIKNKEE